MDVALPQSLTTSLLSTLRYDGPAPVLDLGPRAIPYQPMIAAMQTCSTRLAHNGRPGSGLIVLLEHTPVYTLGKHASTAQILDPGSAKRAGIAVVPTDRGGAITYHGPGQVVAYPIVHLGPRQRDAREWVHILEEAMLHTCAQWGLYAQRAPEKRGVFVEGRKIGSVGVRLSHGVSTHGLALNVAVDLRHFSWIQPCGLSDVAMTSLSQESQCAIDPAEVHGFLGRELAHLVQDFTGSVAVPR